MHTVFLSRRTACALLAGAVLLAGCAGKQPLPGNSAQTAAERAALQTADAAILDVSEQLAKARSAQLDLYSPRNMERASDALADAQKLRAKNRPDSEVLAQTGAVSAFLNAANDNKTLVFKTLQDTIAHRQVLEDLGTPVQLPREYARTTSMFRDLAETLETGNTAKALKEQQKVLGKLTEIEIDTLKAIHLAPAETMLDKAEDVDAKKYAPATFESAENAIETATKVIEAKPRDREGVKAVGAAALFAARKAFNVATESRNLVNLDEKKAEQRALYYFSLIEQMNQSARIPDLGAMSLYDQTIAISRQLERAASLPAAVPAPKSAPVAVPASIIVETPVQPAPEQAPEQVPAPTAATDAPDPFGGTLPVRSVP